MRPENKIKGEVGMKLTRWQILREFPVKFLSVRITIYIREKENVTPLNIQENLHGRSTFTFKEGKGARTLDVER